jgi:hypothetical protein
MRWSQIVKLSDDFLLQCPIFGHTLYLQMMLDHINRAGKLQSEG